MLQCRLAVGPGLDQVDPDGRSRHRQVAPRLPEGAPRTRSSSGSRTTRPRRSGRAGSRRRRLRGPFKIAMCLFTAYLPLPARRSPRGPGGARRAPGRRAALRGPAATRSAATVRAAVYGVLLTALAQGFLAGVGFFAVGTPVPLLLALATVVASLIPFAPPIIYLGAAGVMLAEGATGGGRPGLALWGIAIVSTADNVIRPLFISQATQTPHPARLLRRHRRHRRLRPHRRDPRARHPHRRDGALEGVGAGRGRGRRAARDGALVAEPGPPERPAQRLSQRPLMT